MHLKGWSASSSIVLIRHGEPAAVNVHLRLHTLYARGSYARQHAIPPHVCRQTCESCEVLWQDRVQIHEVQHAPRRS